MPRFIVPSHFAVPETTPHLGILSAAYPLYQCSPWWNPSPIDQQDYILICKYADHYGDPVYKYLVKGNLQGVSLIYHEAAELAWYFQNNLDPFARMERAEQDPAGEEEEYFQSHSLGLIDEHRLLQKWARQDGQAFHLGELIGWNPSSGYQHFDLQTLREYIRGYGEEMVSKAELDVRPEKRDEVVAWYRSREFEGL